MSLKRLHQVVFAEELLEATARSGVFNGAFASALVIDPKINFNPERYDREINRASLTRLQGLQGVRSGTLTFGLELTGTNAFSTAPQYGLPLRGSGFRQETLIKMTIGAITGGPFRHGETVTQTGSSATAVVVGDTLTGETTLWITNQNALGNGTAFTPTGVLTGGSSGATTTPTGFATRLTFTTYTLGDLAVGQTVSQAVTAASGVVTDIATSGSSLVVCVRQTTTANFTASANNVTNSGGGTTFVAQPSAVSTQAQAGYGWWPQSLALSFIRSNGSGIVNAIADGDLLRCATSGGLFQAYGAYGTSAAQTLVYCQRLSGHTNASSGETVTNVTQGNTAFALGTAPNEQQFQIPSLTMGIAKDGVRESIKYARGNVTATGEIGKPMILNFEFHGAFNEITDQGNVGGITNAQTVPPVLIDADLALGHAADAFSAEYVPCIRKLGWGMSNEIAFKKCMADAAGINNTHIVGRKPTVEFDPDLNAEALFSHMGDFLNNVACRGRFTVGSTLGNQVLMKMPAISISEAPTGDSDGISTREIKGELTGGSQTVSALNVENEIVIVAPYA